MSHVSNSNIKVLQFYLDARCDYHNSFHSNIFVIPFEILLSFQPNESGEGLRDELTWF
jgi:hypothetical protein